MLQEEALKVRVLRDIEPLAAKAVSGPKGSSTGACCAVAEQHLHSQPYSEQAPPQPMLF